MLQLVAEWEAILPHWAIRKAKENILEVGNQLPTRDGRRMGNAHIIEQFTAQYDHGRPYYRVLTDAGTLMIMNSGEINECFWPPKYVSDVQEVVRKFGWLHSELQHWVPASNK